MARFYASIQGNRGEATRMGTPSSGISGHIRGWHLGAAVRCYADGEGDTCCIDVTSGSSGSHSVPLATVDADGIHLHPHPDVILAARALLRKVD